MPGPRRAEDAHYEVVEDKAIIIGPDGSELVTLNTLGTLVWESLDGECDLGTLGVELAGRFPAVSRQQLEDDVRTFLGELKRQKLIVGRW